MKYVCLGYIDNRSFDSLPERERHALVDQCFAYDDELRRRGHFAGGEALQDARNAATLRFRDGQVTVTDGPFAETREQIGGILFLNLGRIGEHDGEQVARRRRAVDGPAEALAKEIGQVAAMVDVGMAEDDCVDVPGREGEMLVALARLLTPPLEQAAVQKQLEPIGLD